jgi:hypothetical protein
MNMKNVFNNELLKAPQFSKMPKSNMTFVEFL